MFRYYFVTRPDGATFSVTMTECQTLIMLNLVILTDTTDVEGTIAEHYNIRTDWN